jgi:hypothetical protein
MASSFFNPSRVDFPVFIPNFRDITGAVLGIPFPGDTASFFHQWTRSARKVWLHRRYIHLDVADFTYGQGGMKNLLDALCSCLRLALKEEFYLFMCHLFNYPVSIPSDPSPPWVSRELPTGITYIEMRMLSRLSNSFSVTSEVSGGYAVDTIHWWLDGAVVSLDPADPSNV